MKKITRIVHIAALSLAACLSATAAPRPRVFVECSIESNDAIGARLCAAVRDDIAKDNRYRETPRESNGFRWGIIISTMQAESRVAAGTQGAVFVVASTPTVFYYLNSKVLTTGGNKVGEQAKYVLTALDMNIALRNPSFGK